jgi:TetR/AcrR family transcriptional regulator, cholesterol catabolism regulator
MAKEASANHNFDDRVQHILRHAARVFADKGYDGASIRDISRSSGDSLAGIYYYCESKQKLLYLIELNAFSSILRRLETRLDGVSDPAGRVSVLVQNHLEYFLEHPLEMKVLSHEDEALVGGYAKEVAAIKRRYYQMALGIFEDLRKAGRAGRINPRVAVLSLFGMMNWVYTWHNPRVDPGAGSLAEAIAGIFLAGVANGHVAARPARARLEHRNAVAALGLRPAKNGFQDSYEGGANGNSAGRGTKGIGALQSRKWRRHLRAG